MPICPVAVLPFCGALLGLQFTLSAGKVTERTAMKALAAVYMESRIAKGAALRLAPKLVPVQPWPAWRFRVVTPVESAPPKAQVAF